MTIDELASLVYEDLNGRIVSVCGSGRDLEVVYECDHWRDHDRRVAFRLLCAEVAESTVVPQVSESLGWLGDHPVLHDHCREHANLYFSSVPDNPYEILGRLYQAHERFYEGWREFRDYVNTCGNTVTVLSGGAGLLAKGPALLVQEFEKAITGLMSTNVVDNPLRIGDYGNYRVLLFDESFVVCRTCEVEAAS